LKDGTDLRDALVKRVGAVKLLALRVRDVESGWTWGCSGSVQGAEGNGVSVRLRVDEFPLVPNIGDFCFELVGQLLIDGEAISVNQRRLVVIRVVHRECGVLQDGFAQYGSKSVLVERLPSGAVGAVKSTVAPRHNANGGSGRIGVVARLEGIEGAVLSPPSANHRLGVAKQVVRSANTRRVEEDRNRRPRGRDARISGVPSHASIDADRGIGIVIRGVEHGHAKLRIVRLGIVLETQTDIHGQAVSDFPIVLSVEGGNVLG